MKVHHLGIQRHAVSRDLIRQKGINSGSYLRKRSLTKEQHRNMTTTNPADTITLKLILVSGKTKEFPFSPSNSAADIAKHVYNHWPMALKLPHGKITVMHLVARETLPEPNSQGQRNREKTRESNCCVIL
nr:ubiquitin-like protein 3 isoform X2 [Paramormyrops kingsleyae]